MAEDRKLNRDDITGAIARALEPLDFVHAMWEGGAIAFDRVDEWSDIDICVDADDERVKEAFPVVERALEALAPIELKYDILAPSLGEYVQAFYRLEGAGKFMLVDFAVFRHSAKDKLLVPEIILLTHYNAVPPRRVKFSRRNIFERDRFTCQYCGRTPARNDLSIDHVVPRSRGGSTTWSNVVLACTECNARKRDRVPRAAGMRLQRTPREPAWHPGSGFRLSVRRRSWQRFVESIYWDLKLDEDQA